MWLWWCCVELRDDLGELGVRLAGTLGEARPLRRDRPAIRDGLIVREVHAGFVVLVQCALVLKGQLGPATLAASPMISENISAEQVSGASKAWHMCQRWQPNEDLPIKALLLAPCGLVVA